MEDFMLDTKPTVKLLYKALLELYRETCKVGSRSISYLIGNLFRVNVFKSTCASDAESFMGNETRIIAFIMP